MPTLTISISKELKHQMNQNPEINWPEVLKNRLRKRAEELLSVQQKKNTKGGT